MASPSSSTSTGAAGAAAPAPTVFACPDCNATYRWKPELAGKRIRCKHCESTFSPAGIDPSAVARAAAEKAAARGGYAMLAHQASRKVATEEDELTVMHNLVLPLVVLALGVAWRAWQAIQHAGQFQSVALWESLGLVMMEWALVSAGVAAGVLASATFIEIDLDRLGRAALKVTATAILMTATAHLCSSFDRAPDDLIGLILGVPCVLLLAFFMLAAMFGADLLEGLMGTVAVTVAASAVMIGLVLLIDGPAAVILGFGRPVAG